MDAIEKLANKLDDNFGVLSGKLDTIIERNAKADTALAVLQNTVLNHGKDDDKEFSDIKKKHVWYDKVIIAALVFASTELFCIVVYFVTKK